MQILIISLPDGEQVTSLSYHIETCEALIGQSSSCQIILPDRQGAVTERHARVFSEDDHWYLENISTGHLSVNNTDIKSGSGQHYLLSDGDMIACGEYRLLVSDFSPWQSSTGAGLEIPVLSDSTDHAPEYCPLPSGETDNLQEPIDDPFAQEHESDPLKNKPTTSSDISMQTDHSFSTSPEGCPMLIDVLASEKEEEDDWSINRHLWAGYQSPPSPKSEFDRLVPVLSERSNEIMANSPPHRRSVFQAMLKSLELFMQDMSPEKLEEGFDASSNTDYWAQYQKYYRKMMMDQNYQLLFLHRFRQALRQQEKP